MCRWPIIPRQSWLYSVLCFYFCIVLVLPVPFISTVYADGKKGSESENVTLDIFASKKKEAWMKAGVHAINHKEVGIAVYGQATDATAKQIGEFLKTRLAEHGIKSKYFLAMEEKEGAMIGFYIRDVGYGPTDPDGVPQKLELVIRHFPQAWPGDLEPLN